MLAHDGESMSCPIDDVGHHVTEADLRAALPVIARTGLPLLAHAELPAPVPGDRLASAPRSYAAYLASRPPSWELNAIRLLLRLSREFGCRVHIVHLSASE